ncbi:MAG: hypothetical protein DMF06_15530 [Verrucomicrobia bacterium]|nr:MAG: hypothetical protein DMF06_15530 [Verrucomicrobiota bacterium]
MNSPISPEEFELLLPLACKWAAEQEQHILAEGEPLSEAQLHDARLVGILHRDRVRLLYVPEIVPPTYPMLRQAAEATSLISPVTGGLTLRYGIFIRSDCRGNRPLVVHELGHTLQYERMGGFEVFLRQYLSECLTIGYPEAPMEREVIDRTTRICD